MPLLKSATLICSLLLAVYSAANGNWPMAAGPNANWKAEGSPPLEWSVFRNENIRWRTPLPEAGQSGITVVGDRAYLAVHQPIASEDEKLSVTDIIGLCLDAHTGKALWSVELPGDSFLNLAGGFSDSTVFAPIAEKDRVWFFNRSGSMACYDSKGSEIWRREFIPRFRHNNRRMDPILVDDAILYLEVRDKTKSLPLRKWLSPGVKNPNLTLPEDIDPREVWTYIHAIDKRTGEILWRESAGTSVHTVPSIGKFADGSVGILHGRGGGHDPLEKPYGYSLTRLGGETIWSTTIKGIEANAVSYWDERYAYGFRGMNHLLLDRKSGSILSEASLNEHVSLWRYNPEKSDWRYQPETEIATKRPRPITYATNIVHNGFHYFRSHENHYAGRVSIQTGKVEYLELPAQLIPDHKSRSADRWLWGKGHPNNRPINAQGFAVGQKGHDGTGWGHIGAATPTIIGDYLFWPTVTGTVYVLDNSRPAWDPLAIVAVNDLGEGGLTWTLGSLSFAQGRLYAQTMREAICIELSQP